LDNDKLRREPFKSGTALNRSSMVQFGDPLMVQIADRIRSTRRVILWPAR
jgi:hypothetical protein